MTGRKTKKKQVECTVGRTVVCNQNVFLSAKMHVMTRFTSLHCYDDAHSSISVRLSVCPFQLHLTISSQPCPYFPHRPLLTSRCLCGKPAYLKQFVPTTLSCLAHSCSPSQDIYQSHRNHAIKQVNHVIRTPSCIYL